jgi:hypothetical protein
MQYSQGGEAPATLAHACCPTAHTHRSLRQLASLFFVDALTAERERAQQLVTDLILSWPVEGGAEVRNVRHTRLVRFAEGSSALAVKSGREPVSGSFLVGCMTSWLRRFSGPGACAGAAAAALPGILQPGGQPEHAGYGIGTHPPCAIISANQMDAL